MTDLITHRVPNEEGFYEAPGVELGSKRLAIIDIAEGQQPNSINDGTLTFVFNGEIYNLEELRKQLVQNGYHLKTKSDTEVFALLYRFENIDFVQHLHEMFAISLSASLKAWNLENSKRSIIWLEIKN